MDSPVLVALDGSKNAEKVLPYVEPLLRKGKLRALLLQVLPPGQSAPEAAAQAYLREVSARLAKRKIASDAQIVHGDPADGILQVAETAKAGLVAFTSHGQGGLSQWVFGGVAQKILRGCTRPLLVVRALSDPAERVGRVLVPLDGALGSEAILPEATALARAYGAGLELFHVSSESGVEADDSKLRNWVGREKKRMNARFDEIEKASRGVAVSRVFEEGDAAARIVERARQEPASVIAITNQGSSGLSRWIYGSVCEKILQAAPCPVLITRHGT